MSTAKPQPVYRHALFGSRWGIIAGIALIVLRIRLSEQPLLARLSLLPGDLIFGAVYILPFALCLIAFRHGNPTQRFAALAAATVLAGLASITAFSGVA